jgi:hypothetical protein
MLRPWALPLIALSITPISVNTAHSDALPFDVIAGTWAGTGSLAYESGAPDKLECLGYYRASDSSKQLSIALRCKGDSTLELRAKLSYESGRLSGTWEERTYNASGEASGDALENKVTLKFTGSLDGTMTIDFSQTLQTVSVAISTAQSELKGAKLDLARH